MPSEFPQSIQHGRLGLWQRVMTQIKISSLFKKHFTHDSVISFCKSNEFIIEFVHSCESYINLTVNSSVQYTKMSEKWDREWFFFL